MYPFGIEVHKFVLYRISFCLLFFSVMGKRSRNLRQLKCDCLKYERLHDSFVRDYMKITDRRLKFFS